MFGAAGHTFHRPTLPVRGAAAPQNARPCPGMRAGVP